MGRLVRLARSGRFNELESEWLDALESGRPDLEEMLDAASYLTPEGKLQHFCRAAAIVPEDRSLREHLPTLLGQVFQDHEMMESILATIPPELTSAEAADLAELCLTLTPGSYLETPSGAVVWVEGYSSANRVFLLRSADGSMEAPVPDLRRYRRLPPANLRALFTFERERLRTLCSESPAELIRIVVRGMGGSAGWRQVRARLLEEGLLAPRSWGPWWASARREMETTGLFELTPGGDIALRDTPLSPLEIVQRALERTRGQAQRAHALLEELPRLGTRADEARDELQNLLEAIHAEARQSATADPWGAFLAQVAVARGAAMTGLHLLAPVPTELPPVPEDPFLPVSEKLLEQALGAARSVSPESWPRWWLTLWPKLPGRLCERVAEELVVHGAGAELVDLFSEVATRPDSYPHGFLWLWKARSTRQSRYTGPLPAVQPLTLTFSLLALAERMARPQPGHGAELRKAFLGRVRSALRSDGYSAFRRIVHGADQASLRRLRSSVSSSRALGTSLKEALLEIVRTRPTAPDVPPWQRKDVIWVTESSLDRRREELAHILKVEIPANSRAIGEAAARGDLSENAEWAAALDQQKLLTSRATQMQKEIAKARVITGEMVTTDEVGVGNAIIVEDVATGEQDRFTFLGSWDTSPDQGIYSYMAPFSRRFLGKKVGGLAEPPGQKGRAYRILEIAVAPQAAAERDGVGRGS
jgi:transcription elongation GreA/GreB family factor